jgi:hypothetical protein
MIFTLQTDVDRTTHLCDGDGESQHADTDLHVLVFCGPYALACHSVSRLLTHQKMLPL